MHYQTVDDLICNRAAAKCAIHDYRGALEDAIEAIEAGKSSPGFTAGYVRFYEAALALNMKEVMCLNFVENEEETASPSIHSLKEKTIRTVSHTGSTTKDN